jgi:hypothetical protein
VSTSRCISFECGAKTAVCAVTRFGFFGFDDDSSCGEWQMKAWEPIR